MIQMSIFQRLLMIPAFNAIIYSKNLNNFSNFDYPKNSVFRIKLSVPTCIQCEVVISKIMILKTENRPSSREFKNSGG